MIKAPGAYKKVPSLGVKAAAIVEAAFFSELLKAPHLDECFKNIYL